MMKSYSNPYRSPYLRSYPRPNWSAYPTFSDILQTSLTPDYNEVLRNLLNTEFKRLVITKKLEKNDRKHEWIILADKRELPRDITSYIILFI